MQVFILKVNENERSLLQFVHGIEKLFFGIE